MAAFSDLLRRASERNAAAVEELWSRYQTKVRGLIAKRLNGTVRRGCDTDDVAQSVFAELMRDLPRFEDRGEPAFRRWLYLKAENKVYDKLRKAGTGQRAYAAVARRFAPESAEGGAVDEAERVESLDRLHDALDRIDADERAVLRLRYDQRMGYVDIAECLGLPSADAARKRHARALVSLRDALDEHRPDAGTDPA
jgi:RNA polymerase sigma factor (sigma-70 family)